MSRATFCLFVLATFLVGIDADATTIQVPADSSTIQAAINATVAGDTVLVADGTYTGDGNLDFGGRDIIMIAENGRNSTIIDCDADTANRHRAFLFNQDESENARVIGVTIRNGVAPLDLRYGCPLGIGGAVLCDSTSPVFASCRFDSNSGYIGGAIAAYGPDSTVATGPRFIDCEFAANSAVQGGAMYLEGGMNCYIDCCLFQSNHAANVEAFANGVGGAIATWIKGQSVYLYLTDCEFKENTATDTVLTAYGGAILTVWGYTSATKCVFADNASDAAGGAFAAATSWYDLAACTFRNNTATVAGGACYTLDEFGTLNGLHINLDDCVFDGNSAQLGAGLYAISVINRDLRSTHCTLCPTSRDKADVSPASEIVMRSLNPVFWHSTSAVMLYSAAHRSLQNSIYRHKSILFESARWNSQNCSQWAAQARRRSDVPMDLKSDHLLRPSR